MDAEIQEALQSLPAPPDLRAPQPGQTAQLGRLIDGDLPLQPVLEQLLPQLCSLFSGVAAVVWLQAHGERAAVVGVRYQMDRLLPEAAGQQQHQGLVQLAWRQNQPLLVERSRVLDTPPAQVGGPSNPTGHPLLFAPVIYHARTLAVVEIALSADAASLTADQRLLYVRAASLVARRLADGLARRLHPALPSVGRANEQLDELSQELQELQQQIRQRIERRLQQFEGWLFASLADKQVFAKRVQKLLEGHGLRVACAECGHAAILRAVAIGNAKHGAFVFDHYLDSGRTFHGGSTAVPLIRVVSKPARRAAKVAASEVGSQ